MSHVLWQPEWILTARSVGLDKYKGWMISLRSLTSTNPTYVSLCSSYSYITLFLKFDINSRELLQFLPSRILYNSSLFFFSLKDAKLSGWSKILFLPAPSLKFLTISLKPFNNYCVFINIYIHLKVCVYCCKIRASHWSCLRWSMLTINWTWNKSYSCSRNECKWNAVQSEWKVEGCLSGLLVCGHMGSLQGPVCWWGLPGIKCTGSTDGKSLQINVSRPGRCCSDQDINRWISVWAHTRIWGCTVISWEFRVRGVVITLLLSGRLYLHVCLLPIYYYNAGKCNEKERFSFHCGGHDLFSFSHIRVLCCVPVKAKEFIISKMKSVNKCAQ